MKRSVVLVVVLTLALASGCSGKSSESQPGSPAPSVQVVPTYRRVVSAAVGTYHVCAVLDDGTVWCWGRNDRGQLGLGNKLDQLVPAQVPGIADAVSVVAGGHRTCVARASGTASCWGENDRAGIGNGQGGYVGALEVTSPAQLQGIADVDSLAAPGSRGLAVRRTGQLTRWGGYSNSPQSFASEIADAARIVGSEAHLCVLRREGRVQCMGSNVFGQLGNGTNEDRPDAFVDALGLAEIAFISAGAEHTCALRRDGRLFCWGQNSEGTVGISGQELVRTPTEVAGLANVTAVSATWSATCAARRSGEVLCWGGNRTKLIPGVDAQSVPTPTQVGGLSAVIALSTNTNEYSGEETMCAIDDDGRLSCWGSNAYGKAGTGTPSDTTPPTSVPIPGLAPTGA